MAEDDEFVLAYRTFSSPRAEVIVGMLQSYGINAQLLDRHFNSTNGHLVLATGGYRIMVPESRLRDAQGLLKPFETEDDHSDAPESESFRKHPVQGVFWLLVSWLTGMWAPGWLRKRDR